MNARALNAPCSHRSSHLPRRASRCRQTRLGSDGGEGESSSHFSPLPASHCFFDGGGSPNPGRASIQARRAANTRGCHPVSFLRTTSCCSLGTLSDSRVSVSASNPQYNSRSLSCSGACSRPAPSHTPRPCVVCITPRGGRRARSHGSGHEMLAPASVAHVTTPVLARIASPWKRATRSASVRSSGCTASHSFFFWTCAPRVGWGGVGWVGYWEAVRRSTPRSQRGRTPL